MLTDGDFSAEVYEVINTHDLNMCELYARDGNSFSGVITEEELRLKLKRSPEMMGYQVNLSSVFSI